MKSSRGVSDYRGMRAAHLSLVLIVLAPLCACGDDDPILQSLPFLGPPPEIYAPTCSSRLEREMSVTLLSAAQVAEMKGVTIVRGDLVIASSGISTLDDGIDCLEIIEGDLIIEAVSDLVTIGPQGLSRLEEVRGDIIVRSNTMLEAPLPFFALREIGGDLIVEDNAQLRSVGDTAALVSIGGSLILRNNPRMGHVPTLAGLGSLGGDLIVESTAVDSLVFGGGFTVAGDMRVLNNALLTDASLPSFASSAGSFVLDNNAVLSTLEVGGNGTALSGDFQITNQPSLRIVAGFSGLAEIDGDAIFSDNATLESLEGFDNFGRVGGNLTLSGNPALISASAFARLVVIEGGLIVQDNDALGGLQLNLLSTVSGSLTLTENQALLTLSGLGALMSVTGLVQITANPSLSSCDAQALVDRLIDNGLAAANALVTGNGDC